MKGIKKYFKYYPAILLVVLVLSNLIITRKVALKDILKLSDDTTIMNCSVSITDWNEDTSSDKYAELTEEQFRNVVEQMEAYKYRKSLYKYKYTSHDDIYYTIGFIYYTNEDETYHSMRLSKDGTIYFEDQAYPYLFANEEVAEEVVHTIYEYVCDSIVNR